MSDVSPLSPLAPYDPDSPEVERLRKLAPTERAVRRRMFSTLLRTMVRRNEEGR